MTEANDAARRQRATQRDARSIAAAGTKLQGNAADKHDGGQHTETAGVKAERNCQYENNECFACGKQGHRQWDYPQSQQGKAEKGLHSQSHDQDLKQQQQQQQSTSGPAQRTRSKATGAAPASATPTAGASEYRVKCGGYGNRICCACGVYGKESRLRVHSRAVPEGGSRGYRVHGDGAAPCFPERWAT